MSDGRARLGRIKAEIGEARGAIRRFEQAQGALDDITGELAETAELVARLDARGSFETAFKAADDAYEAALEGQRAASAAWYESTQSLAAARQARASHQAVLSPLEERVRRLRGIIDDAEERGVNVIPSAADPGATLQTRTLDSVRRELGEAEGRMQDLVRSINEGLDDGGTLVRDAGDITRLEADVARLKDLQDQAQAAQSAALAAREDALAAFRPHENFPAGVDANATRLRLDALKEQQAAAQRLVDDLGGNIDDLRSRAGDLVDEGARLEAGIENTQRQVADLEGELPLDRANRADSDRLLQQAEVKEGVQRTELNRLRGLAEADAGEGTGGLGGGGGTAGSAGRATRPACPGARVTEPGPGTSAELGGDCALLRRPIVGGGARRAILGRGRRRVAELVGEHAAAEAVADQAQQAMIGARSTFNDCMAFLEQAGHHRGGRRSGREVWEMTDPAGTRNKR